METIVDKYKREQQQATQDLFGCTSERITNQKKAIKETKERLRNVGFI